METSENRDLCAEGAESAPIEWVRPGLTNRSPGRAGGSHRISAVAIFAMEAVHPEGRRLVMNPSLGGDQCATASRKERMRNPEEGIARATHDLSGAARAQDDEVRGGSDLEQIGEEEIAAGKMQRREKGVVRTETAVRADVDEPSRGDCTKCLSRLGIDEESHLLAGPDLGGSTRLLHDHGGSGM